MAEDKKKTEIPFKNCCQRMPFTEMMRKMMEKKTTESPVDCAEMMSQMMKMCCGPKKKEGFAPQTKANSSSRR